MSNIELKQHTFGHNNMQPTFLAMRVMHLLMQTLDFKAMNLIEEVIHVILGGTVHYCILI